MRTFLLSLVCSFAVATAILHWLQMIPAVHRWLRRRKEPPMTRFYGGPMDGEFVDADQLGKVLSARPDAALIVGALRIRNGYTEKVSGLYCNMLSDGNLYYIGPVPPETGREWEA